MTAHLQQKMKLIQETVYHQCSKCGRITLVCTNDGGYKQYNPNHQERHWKCTNVNCSYKFKWNKFIPLPLWKPNRSITEWC